MMGIMPRSCRQLDLLHFTCFVFIIGLLLYISNCGNSDNGATNERNSAMRHLVEYRYDSASKLVSYDKTVPLVWIGGVPRSGTTLARAILDAHPDVRCGEETRVIPRILSMHEKMMGAPTEKTRLAEAHISEQLLVDAMASYLLTIIAGHGEPAPLLCNKDPFAIRSMELISQMFPKSKFILMIRDGRAVSHSIISRHVTIKGFDMQNYDKSLKDWNRAITTMFEACRKIGPEQCLPVYYERLVLHQKEQMERILRFLGLPWNDQVLHHEDTIGKKGGISLSKKELSTDQVDKPVNQEALAKWTKAIPKHVLDKIHELAPMLKRLGYNTDMNPPDYSKLLDPIAERTLNM